MEINANGVNIPTDRIFGASSIADAIIATTHKIVLEQHRILQFLLILFPLFDTVI